jgi:signal transduction histidine kinase
MNTRHIQAPDLPGTKGLRPARVAEGRLIPTLLVAASVALAGLILWQGWGDRLQLEALFHEEDHLREASCLEHVQDYFDAVYFTLLCISLDDDIVEMRRSSHDYLNRIYTHQWEQHRLSHIYVVERDFTGQRPPFMTLERAGQGMPGERTHSLAREEDEYGVLVAQMRRFAADPGLRAQFSGEISLCVSNELGGRARGYVYSVPIRSRGELVGLVAGMCQMEGILEVLRHGQGRAIASLVNESGDLVLGKEGDPRLRECFKGRLAARGARDFFAQAPETFPVCGWMALWSPVEVVSDQKWWLAYLCNKDASEEHTTARGWFWHVLLSGSVLLAGVSSALLVLALNRRLEERARHLRERRELERHIGQVSEREQRRIGEGLNEDLCQRLSGIEGMSRILEKKLGVAKSPETAVASEVARELKEALLRARQMAEELRPVSVLQDGFVAALRQLARTTEERRGFSCRVEERDFPDVLDPSQATHLYRIAQEAINNVVRHAQATQVVIGLAAEADRVTLTVTDNGVGLAKNAAEGPGMGWRIMRYGSDLIGGTVEIGPGPEGGTRVSCSCPRSADKDGPRGDSRSAPS